MCDVYVASKMDFSTDEKLRIIQKKIINNEPLTISEKLKAGRDATVREINGYILKEDCCYRAVSVEMYQLYLKHGFIYGADQEDEYIEYVEDGKIFNNNRGVDWYLGGVSLKYGEVILECPAYKKYFTPAYDYGCRMAYDPRVRHMKSSGFKNPVPMEICKVIYQPNMELNEERKI